MFGIFFLLNGGSQKCRKKGESLKAGKVGINFISLHGIGTVRRKSEWLSGMANLKGEEKDDKISVGSPRLYPSHVRISPCPYYRVCTLFQKQISRTFPD